MEKEKKVKIKIIPVLIFLIVLGLLYLLVVFIIELPIKNIYIYGNNILTDQEIIEQAGISDYPSYVLSFKKNIKDKLKDNSYIKDTKITKGFLEINITIDEAEPLFINKEGKLILSNNKVVDNDRNIVVTELITDISKSKLKELVSKYSKVNLDIRNKISEIFYEPTEQDKDRFGLYMNDGNLVYITLTKLTNMNYYNSIITDIDCKRGILNLDSGNYFEIKEDICKKEE